MKIKKIMLITFLLFAILTISAVSASENIASDNLTDSEDMDILASGNYDSDDYEIIINDEDEICLDEDDDEYDEEAIIAEITLPTDTPKNIEQPRLIEGEDS